VSNHAYINAESVGALLRGVAACGLRRPVTLVLDNARYQKCQVVKVLAGSLGIELLYLPSYSPNLNLIERLWKFVKKGCLGCRVLPSYEGVSANTSRTKVCAHADKCQYIPNRAISPGSPGWAADSPLRGSAADSQAPCVEA
jgi:hypothetical protein